jgi:hypothetical protein
MEQVELQLNKFDLTCLILRETFVIMMVGKRGSGKTFTIKDLMYNTNDEKNPIGIVVKYDWDGSGFYEEFIPKSLIHCGYNHELISGVLEKYSEEKQYGIIPLVILDGCINNDDILRKNGKNKNEKNVIDYLLNETKVIIAQQYCEKKSFSKKIDYVFIFRELFMTNKQRLYNIYGDIFPTFEYTQNNECIVIHLSSNSNAIQDKVFWYRAEDIPDDFKPFLFDDSVKPPVMK